MPAREVWPFIGKLLLSSAVMGGVVWWVARNVAPALEAQAHGKLRLAVLLLVTGGAGTIVYLALAALLRIEEVAQVWQWIGRKVKRLRRGR